MYKKKSFNVIIAGIATLCLIIVIALVYAGFTGQLTINGTAVGRDSNWDIHFENVSSITTTGTAKVLNNHQPVINSNNRTEINDYEVSLTSPNDTISFTFDAVNDGNYNAKITSLSVGTPQCTSTDSVSAVNMCNNLTYTLTYDSGATVQTNDVLYAKDKLSFKVTLQFNDISNPALLPTAGVSISNLGIAINIEQQGNALVNNDGTVANNRVYHQGDKITLNNEDYYVLADSGAGQDYVVALKDEPLTVAEVNLYGGAGTADNHVNRYTQTSVGTAFNQNGYGGLAYYSSETCGYVNGNNIVSGCTPLYENSDIKYIVDAWGQAKFQNNELKEIDGYTARLLKRQEYNDIDISYSWHQSYQAYWSMDRYNSNSDYDRFAWDFGYNGNDIRNNTRDKVRPVINVYKSALENNNNE